jgi:hypothetical protein
MRRYLLCLPAAVSLWAQSERPGSVSAGFKIGAPLNEARNYLFGTYNQGRWTGGPTVELRLPYRFALELDALYRNNRSNTVYPYQFGANVNAYSYFAYQRTNVWDFPSLLKYRLRLGPARPFISAGYIWSRQSVSGSSLYHCNGPLGSCRPPDQPDPESYSGHFNYTATRRGVTAGAGLEFKTRYVTIAPEVRWQSPGTGGSGSAQVTGIVGFTLGKK